MALSEKVEDKLKEAEGILRDAVYWAAKNEKPVTINAISRIILEIDALLKIDKFQDKLEDMINKKNGDSGPFFGGFF
jgi:hypothetical protein